MDSSIITRRFCHLRFGCRRPNTFLITYLNQRYAICRDIPADVADQAPAEPGGDRAPKLRFGVVVIP